MRKELLARNSVYIGIGSNKGDRIAFLQEACEQLKQHVGAISKTSPIYETEAWGTDSKLPYLNQVIEISTPLEPLQLIDTTLQIEDDLGRVRTQKWGDRTIDIDILFYNDLVISTNTLIVPHPLLHQRNFVLKPLCDIAPSLVHPILKKAINTLLHESQDNCEIALFSIN